MKKEPFIDWSEKKIIWLFALFFVLFLPMKEREIREGVRGGEWRKGVKEGKEEEGREIVFADMG